LNGLLYNCRLLKNWLLNNWLLNNCLLNDGLLYNLRSLDLIFNFIIFNSFNLSRLSNVFSSFLRNIFSSLYGYVFSSFNGNLFLYGIVNCSGDIFFLVFNGLVISPNFFFRDLFGITFGDGFVFNNCSGYLFLVRFFYGIVFHGSSFDRVVFNSRSSSNSLRLSLNGGLNYLRLEGLIYDLLRNSAGVSNGLLSSYGLLLLRCY
jgi:hypothetical protein